MERHSRRGRNVKSPGGCGPKIQREKNKPVSRFILHPKLSNPILQTERLLELNLARTVSKSSKWDLGGHWDTLARGSTAVLTLPTTTVIKEPGVSEVKIRKRDIAKFGTRVE